MNRAALILNFIQPFRATVPDDVLRAALEHPKPSEIDRAPGLLNPFYERWIGADHV